METLTRKERKKLAKGKPVKISKISKPIKVPKVNKNTNVPTLPPINLQILCNPEMMGLSDLLLLDLISAIRRYSYTRGYKNGCSDIQSGTHKYVLLDNKSDHEMLVAIRKIQGEDSIIIVSGMMTWFRNRCYMEGYSSAIPVANVILPSKKK